MQIFTSFIYPFKSIFFSIKHINQEKKREIPLVLSIYSELNNIKQLELSLLSLFNQSILPDKLILWLDEKNFNLIDLPYEITQFVKYGLEIKFVKSLNSYTPFYYALKEFSDNINVVADEKHIYPDKWLEKIYLSYIVNQNDIIIFKADNILINSNNEILPYQEWGKNSQKKSSSYTNFPILEHGILFPTHTYKREFFRKDIFEKYAIFNPSIWIWAMALINNKKFNLITNKKGLAVLINLTQKFSSNNAYLNNKYNTFDKELKSIMNIYGHHIMTNLLK